MMQLWRRGTPLLRIPVRPLLESWEKKTHPAQVRLQSYLDEVERAVQPHLAGDGLYLLLTVDVELPARLSTHYDLENYLTPLVRRLGPDRFRLVEGEKLVGGGSFLELGVAEPAPPPAGGVVCRPSGSSASKDWKAQVRQALLAEGVSVLPDGPVEVHMAIRVPPGRNWVNLWKPAGDAMGPVLGEPHANPFHPSDDRITKLHLHRLDGAGVTEIGMWWSAQEAPPPWAPPRRYSDPDNRYPGPSLLPFEAMAERLIQELHPPPLVSRTREAIQLDWLEEEGVVVLLTPEKIQIRLPKVLWLGPHEARPSSELWRELPGGAPPEKVRSLMEEGARKRRAAFRTCRFCLQRVAPEHLHDEDTCDGCAEQHFGVIH